MSRTGAVTWLTLLTGCLPAYDPGQEDDSGIDETDLGEVLGRVCAPSGSVGVVGATVRVGSAEATSTAGGAFALTDLPPGDHTLHVERGSFVHTAQIEVTAGETLALGDVCFAPDAARIGVVEGQFEDIALLLGPLGITYDAIDGQHGEAVRELLLDPSRLAQYDVLFFTCGTGTAWHADHAEVADNLRAFVEGGGSLYAADWSYYLVEVPFPEMIDFVGDDTRHADAFVGIDGTIAATVDDPAIAEALGTPTAQVRYELGSWAAIEQLGEGSSPVISGTFSYLDPVGTTDHTGPLTATMHTDGGTVLYTSFHTEADMTSSMRVALEQMVFSL